MKPHWFAFNMRIIMFAIAISAVDLWCLMRLELSEPILIGILPILNLSALDMLRLVAAWILHRVCNDKSGNFSLSRHLIINYCALLILVFFYNEYTTEILNSSIFYMFTSTDIIYSSFFGVHDCGALCSVLQYIELFMVVSGLPLFFIWCCRSLKTKFFNSIPLKLHNIMLRTTYIVFISFDIIILLFPCYFEERKDVAFDVYVFDKQANVPIGGCIIRLSTLISDDDDPSTPVAITDSSGRARIVARVDVNGRRNAFLTKSGFTTWGFWLEVSAKNYIARRMPLSEILDQYCDPVRPKLGKIELSHGQIQDDFFLGLDGTFGEGSQRLRIKIDGRFAWWIWDSGHKAEEYGYLKWNKGVVELIPIPYPRREVDVRLRLIYLPVKWGDRFYLCPFDELKFLNFCRLALNPPLPQGPSRRTSSWDTYGLFLRPTDRDRPQSGLPHLPPEIWMRMVLNVFNPNNKNFHRILRFANGWSKS